MNCRENQAASENKTAVKTLHMVAIAAFAFLALANFAFAQGWQHDQFQLNSTTFENGAPMPLSTIYNYQYNGVNLCSFTGAPGGDESPELPWTNVPPGTHSFVVTAFDVTAGFLHWGMYNISSGATGLPLSAGIAGSQYGSQIVNDFGNAEYDGPCPPPNYPPNVHKYVFTVYALGEELTLPGTANFPNNAVTLYQALIKAALEGQVLASASIDGFYSTTPGGSSQ